MATQILAGLSAVTEDIVNKQKSTWWVFLVATGLTIAWLGGGIAYLYGTGHWW